MRSPFNQIRSVALVAALVLAAGSAAYADAGGLKDFGVNLMTLPPGGWSSQRHWHSHEDELVYVLEGELTLVEDGGETLLRAGDCATFAKNSGNGHHMINRSSVMALSGSRLAQPGRCHHLLRHRHDEPEFGWKVFAQGWDVLSGAGVRPDAKADQAGQEGKRSPVGVHNLEPVQFPLVFKVKSSSNPCGDRAGES